MGSFPCFYDNGTDITWDLSKVRAKTMSNYAVKQAKGQVRSKMYMSAAEEAALENELMGHTFGADGSCKPKPLTSIPEMSAAEEAALERELMGHDFGADGSCTEKIKSKENFVPSRNDKVMRQHESLTDKMDSYNNVFNRDLGGINDQE